MSSGCYLKTEAESRKEGAVSMDPMHRTRSRLFDIVHQASQQQSVCQLPDSAQARRCKVEEPTKSTHEEHGLEKKHRRKTEVMYVLTRNLAASKEPAQGATTMAAVPARPLEQSRLRPCARLEDLQAWKETERVKDLTRSILGEMKKMSFAIANEEFQLARRKQSAERKASLLKSYCADPEKKELVSDSTSNFDTISLKQFTEENILMNKIVSLRRSITGLAHIMKGRREVQQRFLRAFIHNKTSETEDGENISHIAICNERQFKEVAVNVEESANKIQKGKRKVKAHFRVDTHVLCNLETLRLENLSLMTRVYNFEAVLQRLRIAKAELRAFLIADEEVLKNNIKRLRKSVDWLTGRCVALKIAADHYQKRASSQGWEHSHELVFNIYNQVIGHSIEVPELPGMMKSLKKKLKLVIGQLEHFSERK